MRLKEFESKRILKSLGMALPNGRLVSTPEEARQAAQEIGGPVVLKVQVLATGRGKAGGVRFADNPEQAEQVARQMLGMEIKGYTVEQLLVEEKLSIAQELYVAATYEERTKGRLMMASESGGMDINEVAEKDPNRIKKVSMGSWIGMHPFQARELAFGLNLTGKTNSAAQSLFLKLWDAFDSFDAILAEINPLVVTTDGRVIAGTVDRLLIQPAEILVVDYKTGRSPESEDEIPRAHRAQMQAYSDALSAIFPGREVRAALLYTSSARFFPL